MRRPLLLATVKRAGFGDRELAAMAGVSAEAIRLAGWSWDLRRVTRWSTHARREFAAETPYFYATYAAAGSEPELPPVERPAALVIGSGRLRIGQGMRVRTTAPSRLRPSFASGAGRAGHDQFGTPRRLSTDCGRLVPPLLRAAGSGERPFCGRGRVARRPASAGRLRPVRRSDAAQPRGTAGGGRDPAPGRGAGDDRSSRGPASVFANPCRSRRHPAAGRGMAGPSKRRWALADRIGYPVIVRPSFVIGGLAIDFSYSPSDLVGQLARATFVDPDRPVGSTATSRELRWTLTRSPMARRC